MVAMMCLSFIVVIFIAIAYLLCECYLSPFIVSVCSSTNGANVCLAHSLCHSCVWSTPCSTVLLLHNLFCTNRMWKWIGTFGNLYSKWYKLCYVLCSRHSPLCADTFLIAGVSPQLLPLSLSLPVTAENIDFQPYLM